jgi:HSP20 family molecular chaperone IbpA
MVSVWQPRRYGPHWPQPKANDFASIDRKAASATNDEPTIASDAIALISARQLTAELPGMDEKDVEIKLSDDMLTMKGKKKEKKEERERKYYLCEHRYGSFRRTFQLPAGVDSSKIEATFAKGVLTLTLPASIDIDQNQPAAIILPTQGVANEGPVGPICVFALLSAVPELLSLVSSRRTFRSYTLTANRFGWRSASDLAPPADSTSPVPPAHPAPTAMHPAVAAHNDYRLIDEVFCRSWKTLTHREWSRFGCTRQHG